MTDTKEGGNRSSRDHEQTTSDGREDAPTKLIAAIDAMIANPPKLARADKRGKFPMAAMKLNDAGNFDMLPLTVAMPEETFERIRDLIRAVLEYRPLLGDGGAKQPSTTDPQCSSRDEENV